MEKSLWERSKKFLLQESINGILNKTYFLKKTKCLKCDELLHSRKTFIGVEKIKVSLLNTTE